MKEYRLETDTTERSLIQLQFLVNTIPEILKHIPVSEFSHKPNPDKWSKKEIMGHLIDSATNNHHRFVRTQFEDSPVILYNQDLWNDHSYYQMMDSRHIIDFWEMYNRHIIELIRQIPPDKLSKECMMSDGSTYAISWLFDDYVRHAVHHLKQIMEIPVAS